MKRITEHKKFESIEEYLAFEEKSEVRHEYYFENLVEMAGSTKLHNQVVFFLTLLFIENSPNPEGSLAFCPVSNIYVLKDSLNSYIMDLHLSKDTFIVGFFLQKSS